MWLALAVLAAVLLLAGCGHAKDPFVGTWQAAAGGAKMVIAPVTGDGHRLTQTTGSHRDWAMNMVGHGEKLSGFLRLSNGTKWTVMVTRLADGRLSFTASDNPVAVVDFSKVSDSTVAP